MPRKSKYVREKETLLEKLGKTKLSDVTEEELLKWLEGLSDESLSDQLVGNWKRATAKCESRIAKEVVEPAEEEHAPPTVIVKDIGIHEESEVTLEKPPQPEKPAHKPVRNLHDGMYRNVELLQSHYMLTLDAYTEITRELKNIRFSVALIGGLVVTGAVFALWGPDIIKWFQ